REPPVAVWLSAPGLEGGIRAVALGPLPENAAAELLVALGVSADRAKPLNRIARGHPLALRLAAATLADQPDRNLDQVAAYEVTDQLARLYLADVQDPDTRVALEAACVVRRVTRSVLAAMAPGAPADRFQLLADLPFVESQTDGLLVHDSVREAIARYLHAVDPSTYRRYRWLAWRRLATEVQAVPPDDLWRYTADMLYLIENPVVREAFFPSGVQPLAVEPARPDDLPAIETMTGRHDGDEAVETVRRWWIRARDSFSIIRDRDGHVTGYSHILSSRQMRESSPVGDPVVDTWREHLQLAPVPRGQLVLGFRRWLDMELGDAPGATQAASWLDVKRTYMALRPQLRRIYVAVREADTYWPIVERLGFRLLPEALRTATVGGATYTSVVLDFGPQSVDGWLAGLVAAELGMAAWELDADAHELRADGRRIGLTPLEFAVLDRLRRIPGRTVSRRELLQDVWGWDGAATSNVVDATVRRLRHKLEDGLVVVETVRGAGYRLQDR
ncbi:MAG TPA: winged helix-turn-helix domain-containing protein, partial [Candidatus Limnocylindria bacterium]